jgi:hypothetical protein
VVATATALTFVSAALRVAFELAGPIGSVSVVALATSGLLVLGALAVFAGAAARTVRSALQ